MQINECKTLDVNESSLSEITGQIDSSFEYNPERLMILDPKKQNIDDDTQNVLSPEQANV